MHGLSVRALVLFICFSLRLMVTGHSLGASMALFSAFNISFWTLFSHGFHGLSWFFHGFSMAFPSSQSLGVGLRSPKAPILYTFGQPRSANGAFARLVEKQLPRIYRLINAADPVPHIPRCARQVKSDALKTCEMIARSHLRPMKWMKKMTFSFKRRCERGSGHRFGSRFQLI